MADRGLFRHRNFLLFFGAESASQIGSQVSLVALPLTAILALRAGPFQVGLLAATQTSAFVLIGLPAGVWVDRMRHRPILIGADLVRGLLLGSVPVAWWLNLLSMQQLYVVGFVVSLATVMFEVAHQSYLPALVGRERLLEANGRLEVVRSSAQSAGPGAGGWLVHLLSAPVAIAVDAVSFLVSALFLGGIRGAETAGGHVDRTGVVAGIREGMRFVVTHEILRMIALRSALANLSFSAIVTVQALFLVDELGMSPGVYGLVLAAGAVGGLLGGAAIGPASRLIGCARLMWVGPLAFQPLAVLIPFTEPGVKIVYFIIGSFAMSFGGALYNVTQISFRQAVTPERLLGRMNATMRFLAWGTMPLGALAAGALGEVYGIRATLWTAVSGLLLSTVLLLFSPLVRIRDLPSSEELTPAV